MDNGHVRGDSASLSWLGAEGQRLVSGQVRTRPDQHFCSIEYVDEEGDKVIRHAFLSVDEQRQVIEEFARRGFDAKIHDLHPPAVSSDQ